MAEGEEEEESSEEEGNKAQAPKADQMSNDELISILSEETNKGDETKEDKGEKVGDKGEDDDGIPDSLDDIPDVDFDDGVPDIEGVDEEALAAEAKAKMAKFEPLLPPPPFL